MYDAISNKRDSHIVKFIDRIKNDNSKKFILTSRTSILTKAVSLSHQFQNHKIREDEFLLRIRNLTEIDKAQILYNHIYHSNLDHSYIDQIYAEKRYMQIIKHRNFNPRIIDFITDNTRINEVKPEDYWNYIFNKLENPEDIWSDFFQNQIDDSVRVLSFLTLFNGGTINENDLSRSYSKFRNIHTINFSDHTDHSFIAVRKLAIKSLLNRSQVDGNESSYSLFNPSIGDFILNSYLEDVDLITSIFLSLGTSSSINFLMSLQLDKRISKENIQQIQFVLLNRLYTSKLEINDLDYLILVSYIEINNPLTREKTIELLNRISNHEDSTGSRLYELLSIINEFNGQIDLQNLSFLETFIKNAALESGEVEKLLEFLNKFKVSNTDTLSLIYDSITTYYADYLIDNKSLIDITQHIRSDYGEYGESAIEIDYDGIQVEIESILDTIISELETDNLNTINLNRLDIIEKINVEKIGDDLLSSYFEQGYDDEFKGSLFSETNYKDDIEAIFERS